MTKHQTSWIKEHKIKITQKARGDTLRFHQTLSWLENSISPNSMGTPWKTFQHVGLLDDRT